MAHDQHLRRFVAFALVAGAHLLLLILPLDTDRRERGERGGVTQRTVLFFPRAPAVERRLQRELRPPAEPSIETNIAIEAPGAITALLSDPSISGSAAAPPIDWTEEGRRAAAAAADKAPSPDRSKCDSTGLADPALPNCKPPPEFKWAPPKAGFANGLPYITVGDRCVVGLGFFGCGFGKPPANGKLFDGMDDPNRDRSSVPEPE
jgi:hypothetical protein